MTFQHTSIRQYLLKNTYSSGSFKLRLTVKKKIALARFSSQNRQTLTTKNKYPSTPKAEKHWIINIKFMSYNFGLVKYSKEE